MQLDVERAARSLCTIGNDGVASDGRDARYRSQGFHEGGAGGISLLGFFLERFSEHGVEGRSEAQRIMVEHSRLPVHDLHQDLDGRFCAKRFLSGQTLIGDTSERKKVRAPVELRCASRLLGRHVVGRSEDASSRGDVRR